MNNFKKKIFDGFYADVWHRLKNTNKPILIYGMGNGADKIISVFERYGIEYEDVFASDGFVRGHSYRGKTVLSYSQACEKYGDGFDVVVSFGTRLTDVMERIYALEKKHEVFAPDVPVASDEIFCEEYFDAHAKELEYANSLFADEKSSLIFEDIIRYKLTGKLCYLKSTEVPEKEADKIINSEKYKVYADIGAYNGDTVRKYLDLCPNLKEIYAMEPDKRNFRKLFEYSEQESRAKINALNFAAGASDSIAEFSSSGNRNSSKSSSGSFEHKTVTVEQRRPDSVIPYADFIKYDVEGAEYEALCGSERLIKECKPDLLVSMYHKSSDTYSLPILVHKLMPEASLYLRRLPYIPAWDLNLYAINK